jgi:DNA (cytosine-5)-methyltransferase 1
MIYYNDSNEYCCEVLRARIKSGQLPDGVVDNRNVQDVQADELRQYRHIHLFAGIGGFPLALQLADFGTDRTIITSGFPCTDISAAGKGAGLAGKQSGLWWETLAAISVVRPQYAYLENVSTLLVRGLGDILGSLAQVGYDAEYHCVPASYVGAPHRRDRIWIVAHAQEHAQRTGLREGRTEGQRSGRSCDGSCQADVADADMWRRGEMPQRESISGREAGPAFQPLADAGRELLEGGQPTSPDNRSQEGSYPEWWAVEPDVGRVAHGVPARVDRLKGLGNAIVPQCAAYVLRKVLDRRES